MLTVLFWIIFRFDYPIILFSLTIFICFSLIKVLSLLSVDFTGGGGGGGVIGGMGEIYFDCAGFIYSGDY